MLVCFLVIRRLILAPCASHLLLFFPRRYRAGNTLGFAGQEPEPKLTKWPLSIRHSSNVRSPSPLLPFKAAEWRAL